MVFVREDLEQKWDVQGILTYENLLMAWNDLIDVIDEITLRAKNGIGPEAASILRQSLLKNSELMTKDTKRKYYETEKEQVMVDNTKENQPPLDKDVIAQTNETPIQTNDTKDNDIKTKIIDTKLIDVVTSDNEDKVSIINKQKVTNGKYPPQPAYADAVVEVIAIDEKENISIKNYDSVQVEDTPILESPSIEIVGDDEQILVNVQAESIPLDDLDGLEDGENKTKKEENPIASLTLSAIDILFFVVEKIFLGGIPRAIKITGRFSSRLNQAQRSGSGYEGWSLLENVKDAKTKY